MPLLRSCWADANFRDGRQCRCPSSRKDLCKRPLGQGKGNFDMARKGSYLHLAFGGRPWSYRGSFRLSHLSRDELVTPHESSPHA
jgi:hypothetical protein